MINTYKYKKLIFEGDCKINNLPGFRNMFSFVCDKDVVFINRSHSGVLVVNGKTVERTPQYYDYRDTYLHS